MLFELTKHLNLRIVMKLTYVVTDCVWLLVKCGSHDRGYDQQ